MREMVGKRSRSIDDEIAVFLINGDHVVAYAKLDFYGDGYLQFPCSFYHNYYLNSWPFFYDPEIKKEDNRVYVGNRDYCCVFTKNLDPVLIEKYEEYLKTKYDYVKEDN